MLSPLQLISGSPLSFSTTKETFGIGLKVAHTPHWPPSLVTSYMLNTCGGILWYIHTVYDNDANPWHGKTFYERECAGGGEGDLALSKCNLLARL